MVPFEKVIYVLGIFSSLFFRGMCVKILVVNHYDCRNKGDHSVLSAMLESLKGFFPASEIIVLSHHPRTDRVRCNATILESIIMPSPGIYAKLVTLVDMTRCMNWALFMRYLGIGINKLIPAQKTKTMSAYAKADVVLARSTDWFNDVYGFTTFLTGFYEILIAVLMGKKTVIYAQTIGPVKNDLKGKVYKFALRALLSRINLIMVREKNSEEFLRSIGLNRPPVYVTADPAFSLQPSSQQRADEIFEQEGVPRDSSLPLIGINISRLTYQYCFPELKKPNKKYDRYTKLMAELIDHATDKLNATVVLVPHVFGPGAFDDRKACRDVFRRVKNKQRTRMIRNEYTPEELRSVIGRFDFFIGMRMHAIIQALSMQVPTIGIDHLDKVRGIMTMAGQGRLVCRADTLNLNELLAKVKLAIQNKDKIKETLASRVKILQKKSTLNTILVKKLLESTP